MYWTLLLFDIYYTTTLLTMAYMMGFYLVHDIFLGIYPKEDINIFTGFLQPFIAPKKI